MELANGSKLKGILLAFIISMAKGTFGDLSRHTTGPQFSLRYAFSPLFWAELTRLDLRAQDLQTPVG